MYAADSRYLLRAVDYRSVLGKLVRDHLGASQEQLNRIIPGYAEGEYVRIASPIAGTLAKVYVRAGDTITVTVSVSQSEDAQIPSEVLAGFPITYTVTQDPVQTLWLQAQ